MFEFYNAVVVRLSYLPKDHGHGSIDLGAVSLPQKLDRWRNNKYTPLKPIGKNSR